MKQRTDQIPRALKRELERTARDPQTAASWAARMLEARDAGKHAAAYQSALRLKQAAPRAPSARRELGMAAFALEKWHEAAQELLAHRRLTGDRTKDPVIAECYRRLGRGGRALEFLADLPSATVPRAVWIEAQTVRARALADGGRPEVGVSILEALRLDRDGAGGAAAARARAMLAELAPKP